MSTEMNTKNLWDYYKALSEFDKGEYFSINWFYTGEDRAGFTDSAGIKDYTTLNNLTKAFLADDAAMDSLKAIVPPVEPQYGENANRLNESQKEAIRLAINNPITIVQGPPGTGKTETIKNLLICLRGLYPDAKIAMVSTNKDAVDNVEAKIRDCDCLREKFARLGNKSLKEKFASSHENYKMDAKNKFKPDLLNEFPIILSTIHSLRKCFADFDNQYDYVIVDECSQVSTRLGLLAMASAKHLVLFGDDNQLSPIHKYKVNDDNLTRQVEEIGKYYFDKDNNSFMHACYERFGDKAAKIMLNEHYRCHPNIINFCNQNFYDGKLKIQTANDNSFPIRIRWYEGDYWEHIYKEDEGKNENEYEYEPVFDSNKRKISGKDYNMKQIEIFIEDELPHIIQKFIEAKNNGSEYSICVLSPYKYQIKMLTEKLKEKKTIDRLREKVGLTSHDLGELLIGQQNSGTDNEKPSDFWDLPSWSLSSIHKSQGKEYDYVCVMPVVDDTSKTWHQSARITNVAISRAKNEICYIMSSNWMTKATQEKIMDDRTKEMLRVMLDGLAPNLYNSFDYKEQNMGYLPKLVEYVIQNEDKWKDSENYGLIRTSIHSIFDIKHILTNTYGTNKTKHDDDTSAFEECLCSVLYDRKENDKKNGGPLKDIEMHYHMKLGYKDGSSNVVGMNADDVDNAREFIKNAHFDLVLTRGDDPNGNNGKIALIIEVDGAQHRGAVDFDREGNIVHFDAYKSRKNNDEIKNSLVRTIGEDFYKKRFLRLDTCGTTCDEIELIIHMIAEADRDEIIQPRFKEDKQIDGN